MFSPARAAYLLTEFGFACAAIVATIPAAIVIRAAADMDDWTTTTRMPPTFNRSLR